MQPRVTAVVIHFGKRDFTDHLVRQLLGLASAPEIVVVDNASVQAFDAGAFPGVRALRLPENRGYGHACNRGADAAAGEFLFILNNDLDIPSDPLPPLLAAMDAEPRAGAAGPALRFPDGRFQLSYGEQPAPCSEFLERRRQRQSSRGGGAQLDARAREAASPLEPHWITGACMLVRRKAWEMISGFDEAYFFYFEDVDLCTRLRRSGWTVLYRPEAEVIHFGGGSDPLSDPRIVASYRREQLRYYARFNSRLSFFLLQRYLLWKFARAARDGSILPPQAAELETMIRAFPRRAERVALTVKENR